MQILKESEDEIILDDEGFQIRAKAIRLGAFAVVAIDFYREVWCAFHDGMLWYKSFHMRDWEAVNIASWTYKYKNLLVFLKDYPQLLKLFASVDFPD